MNITGKDIKACKKLGQAGAASGIAIPELARRYDDFMVAVADSVAIARLDRFANTYPERIINVGIAEQNLIGVSSGLASVTPGGVFAYTYTSFLIVRALEQIRLNLAYQQHNVKLVGVYSGYTMGTLGVSHWASEDIAFMRALPNITILSASDSLQAIKMMFAAYEIKGPVYIRLSGGMNCPTVYKEDFDYRIGQAIELRSGLDVAIVATGLMVGEALKAAEILETDGGISCAVIDMHTIKPLDTQTIDRLLEEYRLIVTVEEGSAIGGLGGAVAEYRTTGMGKTRHLLLGAGDYYTKLGRPRYIWEQYGLTDERIAEAIRLKWEMENT